MAGGALAVVYSNDCPPGLERVTPDGNFVFVCDGTADEVQINAAIGEVAATGQTSSHAPTGGGGKVLLVGNTFNIAAPIQYQSWAHIEGALGWAGTQVNCSPGFSGVGAFVPVNTYVELADIGNLRINGTVSGTEHGIYFTSQVTQTPFTYSDPGCSFHDLWIYQSGADNIHFDTTCRATHVTNLIKLGKAGGYAFWGGGLVDSVVANVHTEGSALDGLYAAGSDTLYTNFQSYNAHGQGITLAGVRINIHGSKATDASLNNWNIASGQAVIAGCTSDSAGLGTPNTYDGFSIASGLGYLAMQSCFSYDRNGTPHQRYGVFIGAAALQNSNLDVVCHNNATAAFGGNTTPGTGSSYRVTGN